MALLSIAGGELQRQAMGHPAETIESRLARDMLERDAASRRTTAWKHAERDDNERGMLSGAQIRGRRGAAPDALAPPRFLYACADSTPGVLYYLMCDDK